MEKLVYTVHETAEILCIGICKAYELIQEKQIPVVKVGHRYIVPKKALEKWLEEKAGVQA